MKQEVSVFLLKGNNPLVLIQDEHLIFMLLVALLVSSSILIGPLNTSAFYERVDCDGNCL